MKKSNLIFFVVLLVLAPLCIAFGVMSCPEWISFDEFTSAFSGDESLTSIIVIQMRLPRILLAFLTGAILALSGFHLQALVKNPLADPYIMGVSSGGGFGANLLLSGILGTSIVSVWTLPLFSFAGSMLCLLLLLVLGGMYLRFDTVRLLLAGVALSSFFTALTGMLIFLAAEDNGIRGIVNWTLGSFAGKHMTECIIAAVLLLILWLTSWFMAPSLDVLSLGEAQAASLGLNIRRTRFLILGLTSVCVGGIVAFTGPIGFVGLMVPHFLRKVNGNLHQGNMLIAPLAGGIYLCSCDILAQWLMPPAGLPVGIITALLGAPFFVMLLLRK